MNIMHLQVNGNVYHCFAYTFSCVSVQNAKCMYIVSTRKQKRCIHSLDWTILDWNTELDYWTEHIFGFYTCMLW